MSEIIASIYERSVLLALRELEFSGCQLATELGLPAVTKTNFGRYGVPYFLLDAWLHPLSKDSNYKGVFERLFRRNLITEDSRKLWPYPLPLRLVHADGRTVWLFVERLPISRFFFHDKSNGCGPIGIGWGTYIGKQQGTRLYNVGEAHGWCDPDGGFKVFNLTGPGLELADQVAANGETSLTQGNGRIMDAKEPIPTEAELVVLEALRELSYCRTIKMERHKSGSAIGGTIEGLGDWIPLPVLWAWLCEVTVPTEGHHADYVSKTWDLPKRLSSGWNSVKQQGFTLSFRSFLRQMERFGWVDFRNSNEWPHGDWIEIKRPDQCTIEIRRMRRYETGMQWFDINVGYSDDKRKIISQHDFSSDPSSDGELQIRLAPNGLKFARVIQSPNNGGEKQAIENAGASIEDEAMLPTSKLAEIFGVKPEALRKRMDRYRSKNQNGWMQNTEAGPRESKYLYQVRIVRPIIAEMKASGSASGKRPPKK